MFWQQCGIRSCGGLSSSGADTDRTETEFHNIFQDLRCVIAPSETQTTTRGGISVGWAFRSKLRSHHLPNERAEWLRRIKVTIVHASGHDRTLPANQSTTLLFSTIIHATALPRTSLLSSPARFVQLAPRTQHTLSFHRTNIVSVVPQHMQGQCFGNREPSSHDQLTGKAHDEISTRSGLTVYGSCAHTHGTS